MLYKTTSLLCTFLLLSCVQNNEIKELNLTYVKSPLNVPAIVNYKNSMFSNDFTPIKINYHEINSGSQQTEAMAAGSIDFATVLGGTSAILAAANDSDIKIIGMFARAPKAYMIMGKDPQVTSTSHLKGKKIGGPKGTVLHQLLIAALKQEELNINDVEFISMGISEALTSILSGKIDIALLGGPATLLAQKQGVHIITTGEGLIDGSTVIATHGDMIIQHPAIVKQFLATHLKSLEYMQENPEETLKLTAKEVGLSITDVQSMLPYYDFSPKITQTDVDNLNKTQDFLWDTGLLSQKIDINTMIVTE